MNPLIAGAIGENKVQNELKQMSIPGILFNDYSLEFTTPIINKKKEDKIYSIQVDHLLLTRAGIFILETKNWSRDSIANLDLRSPIDQIDRFSYALFMLIHKKNEHQLELDKHHWGERQVPIRKIVVMINHKPKEEFKYIKVLKVNRLRSYIEHFEPIMTETELTGLSKGLKQMLEKYGSSGKSKFNLGRKKLKSKDSNIQNINDLYTTQARGQDLYI